MYNIHFIPIFIGDHLLQPAVVYNPDCTSRYWTQNPFTVISVLLGHNDCSKAKPWSSIYVFYARSCKTIQTWV